MHFILFIVTPDMFCRRYFVCRSAHSGNSTKSSAVYYYYYYYLLLRLVVVVSRRTRFFVTSQYSPMYSLVQDLLNYFCLSDFRERWEAEEGKERVLGRDVSEGEIALTI